MSLLGQGPISSAAYNSLPHIRDVANVATVNSKDIEDLRILLRKHGVPDGICIRLIHKHYDTKDGELMVLRNITVPSVGDVQILGPMSLTQAPPLYVIHYIVDDDGKLLPYEYTTCEPLDFSEFSAFFDEFCRLIIERGLQRKLGLRIGLPPDKRGWTEFEVPIKRGSVLVPGGIPLPDVKYDITTTTEWYASHEIDGDCNHNCGHGGSSCGHCCHHCDDHCGYDDSDGEEIRLGGKELDKESLLYNIFVAAQKGM